MSNPLFYRHGKLIPAAEIKKAIAAGADPDMNNRQALMNAIDHGTPAQVRTLLLCGATLPKDNKQDWFVRHAIRAGSPAKIDHLASAGLTMGMKFLDGTNGFHELSLMPLGVDPTPIAQRLLNAGASIHARAYKESPNLHGREQGSKQPLHHMAEHGVDAGVIEQALRLGADVNARSFHGYTPLSLARNKEIAQVLLEGGADLDIELHSGKTVAQHCYFPGAKDFIAGWQRQHSLQQIATTTRKELDLADPEELAERRGRFM